MLSDPNTPHEPMVLFEHLTKRYGDREAVRDLSVRVPEGSIAVFLGPNGAGKSTTLEMLTTLRPPTSGRIEVAGLDVIRDRARVRAVVGYVPQANALDPSMTVAESLAFQLRAMGVRRRSAARADAVVDILGLAPHLPSRVSKLSGGTRRRVDLALALAGAPRLLVLDEPTTGLDPASRLRLWTEIRRLVEADGMTVVMSTQDLHEADVLATDLHILRDGSLVASGAPSDLKQRIGERNLVLEGATPAAADAIAARLDSRCRRAGPETVLIPLAEENTWVAKLADLAPIAEQIASASVHEPTLDEVFAVLTAPTGQPGAPSDEKIGANA